MPAPYDYSSTTGYARTRADWTDFPSTTTPITQAQMDPIDQAIFDLKKMVYNVKDYGAKGDDSTDDTTAIQNAINAAQTGKGIVEFPYTTSGYKITSTLTVVGHHVILRGQGPVATLIRWRGAGTGPILDIGDGAGGPYEFNRVFNMRLINNGPVGTPTATKGMRIRKVTYPMFVDVDIYGSTMAASTGISLEGVALSNVAPTFWNVSSSAWTTLMNAAGTPGMEVRGGTWSTGTTGFTIDSTCDTPYLDGVKLESLTTGVNATAKMGAYVGVRYDTVTTQFVFNSGSDDNWVVAPRGVASQFAVTNNGLRNRIPLTGYDTVASAATVTLPLAETVSVTGTTNITSVAASWAGRRVTLIFAGILTFTDGSNLKLAGNFVTTADDTISLVCDGTNWVETGRSVN